MQTKTFMQTRTFMQTKTLSRPDGLDLTYYRAGQGAETLVITNAPGMSIRFWAPVIALLEDRYSIVAMEYRGFPEPRRELTDAELAFPNYLEDLRLVLEREGVERAHFLSWCLGCKVAWQFQKHYPETVQSLLGVGMAFGSSGARPDSDFSNAMFAIKQRIESQPQALDSIINMMKRIGFVPDADFFTSIFQEEDNDSVLSLMDTLEAESSMSTLAFYLLDHPVGLRNYLRMYEIFRSVPIAEHFPRVDVPVTVITGSEDQITPISADDERLLATLPRVRQETVDGASHFLPIEFPIRLSRRIDHHLRTATRPVLAGAGSLG